MTDALPFHPFPERLGEYIPCAAVADYLDEYHKALGLHLLTSAHATTSYDMSTEKWTILVSQPDQPTITVISKHLIVATGVGTLRSEVPFVPSIPGRVCISPPSVGPGLICFIRHLSWEYVCTLASSRILASPRDKMQSLLARVARVTILLRTWPPKAPR